jgi:hypothetical protein
MNFLNPGLLGPQFKLEFLCHQSRTSPDQAAAEPAEEVKSAFVLRCLKTDKVFAGLSDKPEMKVFCTLQGTGFALCRRGRRCPTQIRKRHSAQRGGAPTLTSSVRDPRRSVNSRLPEMH